MRSKVIIKTSIVFFLISLTACSEKKHIIMKNPTNQISETRKENNEISKLKKRTNAQKNKKIEAPKEEYIILF